MSPHGAAPRGRAGRIGVIRSPRRPVAASLEPPLPGASSPPRPGPSLGHRDGGQSPTAPGAAMRCLVSGCVTIIGSLFI